MKTAGIMTALAIMMVLVSCSIPTTTSKRLPSAALRQCLADEGRESRTPFGTPICQISFKDGGKRCSGKSDCMGRCLSNAPENWQVVPIGTSVAGFCESEKSTFGCHANVQGGVLAESYFCED